MTPYADPERAQEFADLYGVVLPHEPALTRLLELATLDLNRHLGAAYVPAELDPEQAEALADATAMQACFRVEQGPLQLGTDDGIAQYADVSVSLRPIPRLSIEARERVAGMGLFLRSGTVPPPLVDG